VISPSPEPGLGSSPDSGDAGLSLDGLLGGRVRILQPRRGYRVAVDPVLLAAAVPARPGESVLDAGSGSGAVALCLASRVAACRITGLERDPELLALARRSVALNDLEGQIELVAGDLAGPSAVLDGRHFDQVATNPPFLPASRSRSSLRAEAHIESVALEAWFDACLKRLKPQGWLTLIHRADRLDAILAALGRLTGDVAILPVWPKEVSAEAVRVIVRARKGSRGPARLCRGLVLHEADGSYTAEASAILRQGRPLDF
jgi:tRNA1(Val) A37 N6-methylase TrmN6